MNLIEKLLENLSDGKTPNQFTLGMGNLIRKAREDSGLSQRELARKIYRRQAALSEIENGKMQPDAETLLGISLILNKPISYFYPTPYKPGIESGTLSEIEEELLLFFHDLSDDDKKKILIQIKALAKNQ